MMDSEAEGVNARAVRKTQYLYSSHCIESSQNDRSKQQLTLVSGGQTGGVGFQLHDASSAEIVEHITKDY